jgi:hypothetical protein
MDVLRKWYRADLVQPVVVAAFLSQLVTGARLLWAISPRIVPGLLQFSTFNWFLGGLALIAAAIWFEQGARLATGLLVGSSYLYGALGNLWATRGRHFGWMLYAVAIVLIAVGLNGFGG